MFQPCILCHFLLILQGGISLSSFGQGFGVGGLGTGVGLQHRNALNRNRCYWEGFGFQQWVCLLIHLLVWRCFERLDLLLIVCPASLFYLFFLGDAQDTSGIAKYSQHPQLAEFLHLCYPETKMAMVFHTPLGCSAAQLRGPTAGRSPRPAAAADPRSATSSTAKPRDTSRPGPRTSGGWGQGIRDPGIKWSPDAEWL